ncbi:MAG: ankyrin repeat domain-containing protein [Pirellulales bacterium]
MERLIAAGADPKAQGDDGMTPLLWAFPERKLERFECLLKHGADPNVVFKSNFGLRGQPFHPGPTGGVFLDDRGCEAGQSVTLLAARSPVIEYLRLVLDHGGDVRAVNAHGESPLHLALNRFHFDMDARVEILLKHGADFDLPDPYSNATPAILAVQNDRYDVALTLLRKGADYKATQPNGKKKVIHFVWRKQQDIALFPKPTADRLRELIEWLDRHGETLAQAADDEAQWKAKTP